MPSALSVTTSAADNLWVPKIYSKAMTCPNLWKAPMDEEMEKMGQQKVWRLVERPKGARTIKN